MTRYQISAQIPDTIYSAAPRTVMLVIGNGTTLESHRQKKTTNLQYMKILHMKSCSCCCKRELQTQRRGKSIEPAG